MIVLIPARDCDQFQTSICKQPPATTYRSQNANVYLLTSGYQAVTNQSLGGHEGRFTSDRRGLLSSLNIPWLWFYNFFNRMETKTSSVSNRMNFEYHSLIFFKVYFLVLWMHAGNNILETYTCNHFKILQKLCTFHSLKSCSDKSNSPLL